ncbi:MAG: helix-turn-helix transcriptional regulator [Lachnospiraceae bacterium]|nr:helix-turn-helix transcriptional regulator [Lachnospiraceae bacterium]MBD5506201.1 helix-turn-helix transcriptional regulator [Lachnospiraceae bacterium]
MKDYKVGMGERMKQQRKLLHMTQEQIAEKLNVSVKHYGGVERGNAGLSIENLIIVSDILEIDLNYLIRGEEPIENIPSRMKEIYLNSPPDKRQHIMELLEVVNKF